MICRESAWQKMQTDSSCFVAYQYIEQKMKKMLSTCFLLEIPIVWLVRRRRMIRVLEVIVFSLSKLRPKNWGKM